MEPSALLATLLAAELVLQTAAWAWSATRARRRARADAAASETVDRRLAVSRASFIDVAGDTAWRRTSSRPDDRPSTQEIAEHMHRAA